MSSSTQSRGEQSRETIILAAHDLFLQQGYHGTSMRQIASRADLALGGLYNHFTGKEDIFRAVFIKYHPYHTVIPSLKQAEGDSVEELVRDSARRFLNSLQEHPEFLNLMFIEHVEFNDIHVSELFNQIYRDALQIVDRIIGTEPKRLRPIPAIILMRTFLGLFFSFYLGETMLAQNAPQEFHDNAMEHLIDIFLHGILKPTTNTPSAGA